MQGRQGQFCSLAAQTYIWRLGNNVAFQLWVLEWNGAIVIFLWMETLIKYTAPLPAFLASDLVCP